MSKITPTHKLINQLSNGYISVQQSRDIRCGRTKPTVEQQRILDIIMPAYERGLVHAEKLVAEYLKGADK